MTLIVTLYSILEDGALSSYIIYCDYRLGIVMPAF